MNSNRNLVVLGGECLDGERLSKWVDSADFVCAVDGGYHNLAGVKRRPHVIAGDFDSVIFDEFSRTVKQVPLPDQDFTDFAKVLRWLEEEGAQHVHVACSDGGLPDHSLQNLFTAAACNLDVRIVYPSGLGRIIRPGNPVTFRTEAEARVSIIPLAPCRGVQLTGTHWTLKDAILEPFGPTGISNRAVGAHCEASIDSGAALLFWETKEIVWE